MDFHQIFLSRDIRIGIKVCQLGPIWDKIQDFINVESISNLSLTPGYVKTNLSLTLNRGAPERQSEQFRFSALIGRPWST